MLSPDHVQLTPTIRDALMFDVTIRPGAPVLVTITPHLAKTGARWATMEHPAIRARMWELLNHAVEVLKPVSGAGATSSRYWNGEKDIDGAGWALTYRLGANGPGGFQVQHPHWRRRET
jgi:hypothetical protein